MLEKVLLNLRIKRSKLTAKSENRFLFCVVEKGDAFFMSFFFFLRFLFAYNNPNVFSAKASVCSTLLLSFLVITVKPDCRNLLYRSCELIRSNP